MKYPRYFAPRPPRRATHLYHYRPPPSDHPLLLMAPLSPRAADPATLPPAVDLRNLCLPIRDQGQEGACSGFAAAAFREVCHAIATENLLPNWLSPAYIYAKTRMDNHTFPGDGGASLADEFTTLMNWGVCPESFIPFNQDPTAAPSSAAEMAALPFRIQQALQIKPIEPVAVKSSLAGKQAVAIGFYIFESFDNPDPNGVVAIPNPNTEKLLGGHAVLVCGYDDAKSWWVVRNQQGPTWADQGYCYMPYGYESFWSETWTAISQA
jgi:C1A family cysteine protease